MLLSFENNATRRAIIVVGFGILNTILMAILERTRELGVVLALGRSPLPKN